MKFWPLFIYWMIDGGIIQNARSSFVPDLSHGHQKAVELYSRNGFSIPDKLDVTQDFLSPIKMDPGQNLQNPLQVVSTHDLQGPGKLDAMDDLQKPFEMYTTHDDIRSSIELDLTHHPQNPVEIDPTHDVRKPIQVDQNSHFLKLFQKDTKYNLWKTEQRQDFPRYISTQGMLNNSESISHNTSHDLQNYATEIPTQEFNNSSLPDTRHDFLKNILRDPTLDFRNKDKFYEAFMADGMHVPQQQYEPMHDFRDPVQTYPTNDLLKLIFPVSKLYLRELAKIPTNHDTTKPVQVNLVRNNRQCAEVDHIHDNRKSIETDPRNDMKKHLHIGPTHDMRKSLQVDPTHDMRKPSKVDPTHYIRNPVEVHTTNDMRKPVEVHPKHDMRKPGEVHPTQDMKKSVDVHPTHDMRKPVQQNPTHNLRKPVKLMETHDLRWPVAEEFDHNIRNSIPEMDIFRSDDMDETFKKIFQEYFQKTSKNSVVEREHDLIYQLLYEDELLMQKCTPSYLTGDSNATSNGTEFLHTDKRMKTEYKELFNESAKACGIPFNKSKEQSVQERKSTKWPWMVSLQEYVVNRFLHKCSGSLLNNLWVVTAAHCVESRPKWDFLLKLGMDDHLESRRHIERFVDRISIHPKFNNLNFDHDIALLRMDTPVVFQPDIVPICLLDRTEEIENKNGIVLGWLLATEGSVTYGSSQEKTVPLMTNKECELMFSEAGRTESIQKSFICANFQDRIRDSCARDSGGPLVVLEEDSRWSLAGVYSWGKTCRSPNQPDVYIRISRYAEWIEDTISCYENNIERAEKVHCILDMS